MAGFDNDTMYADNVDFSGSATPAPTVTLDGQLLIGSTAAPNIRVATLTAGAGISITNGAGSIIIASTGGGAPVAGLTPDAFTGPGTNPVVGDGSGNITITGAQVAAGVVGTNVIRTDSLAANTMTIEIQRATSAAVSTPADNGVSHFDNTSFTVGTGGFVSLIGGAGPSAQKFNVDANTGPGTDPVIPTALGVVTITGAQVAAGTVGANVIRTDSLAANTFTIEIQRSTTAAASTSASNGVSHFDSAIFTIDVDGFVSLVGGAVPVTQKFNVDANTVPGTDPVVADGSGVVTVTGAQVATGTIGANVIRTNSVAANAYRIEIQRSTAVAGTDSTKNGVAHFNSANFSVDADGFVSLSASTPIAAAMAFLSTKDSNVTGNAATYTLGSGGALTIAFDNGGNMTTGGVFTAPTTGKYLIGAELLFDNLTAAMIICVANLRTTLGVYPFGYCNPGAIKTGGGGAGGDLYSISGQVLANMTAGNTFTVDCQIQGGAGDTASVNGVGSRRVNMYAYLVSAP